MKIFRLKIIWRLALMIKIFFISCQSVYGQKVIVYGNYIYHIESQEGYVGYIFGSIHRTTDNLKISLRIGSCVKKILESTSTVVLEAEPNKTQESYGQHLRSKVTMSEISPHLTSSEIWKLNKYLFGLESGTLDSWATSLDGAGVVRGLGLQFKRRMDSYVGKTIPGWDDEIIRIGTLGKKQFDGLETPEEILSPMLNSSAEAFAKKISSFIAELDLDEKESANRAREAMEFARELEQAAATGDEEIIKKIKFFEKIPLGNPFLPEGVSPRNKIQAERIDAMLRKPETKKPVFIAIGAGHVFGSQGVPALLAAKGYKVQRLCAEEASISPATTGSSPH